MAGIILKNSFRTALVKAGLIILGLCLFSFNQAKAYHYYLFPSADGSSSGFTWGGSSVDSLYDAFHPGTQSQSTPTAIDDIEGFTTYAQSMTAPVSGTVEMTDGPAGGFTVNGVTFYIYAEHYYSGGAAVKLGIEENGSQYVGDPIIIAYSGNGSRQWYSQYFATNPHTGNDWTSTEVNNMKMAIQATNVYWGPNFGGVYVDLDYNEAATVSSLTLTPSGVTIYVNGTRQYSCIGNMSDNTHQSFTSQASWSSSDTSVATVTGGLVTGQGAGTATITASYQGLTANQTITILAAESGGTGTGGSGTAQSPYYSDWTGETYSTYEDYQSHSTVRLWDGSELETDIILSRKDFILQAGIFGALYSGILGFALFKAVL